MTFEKIFENDPSGGARYLGEITKISIIFGAAEEAAVRARLAARFAARQLKFEEKYEKQNGIANSCRDALFPTLQPCVSGEVRAEPGERRPRSRAGSLLGRHRSGH